MARAKGFVDSILSSRKQRRRFFYFRIYLIPFITASIYVQAQHYVDKDTALILGIISLPFVYKLISPAIAFMICFIEEMFS